ncbi:MAG: DUF4258 domain-containing protein [Dehalococcoidia bacterium]|nr:DUF4258 domain-containing protein [Dehalococcoidia bacterium]
MIKLIIVKHAENRMREYDIPEGLVINAVQNPDNVLDSYKGRKIYQKKLNGYMLRVIVEEDKEVKKVITVYKARSGRYEI